MKRKIAVVAGILAVAVVAACCALPSRSIGSSASAARAACGCQSPCACPR